MLKNTKFDEKYMSEEFMCNQFKGQSYACIKD